MRINLRKFPNEQNEEQVQLIVTERLPLHLINPCKLQCSYRVVVYDAYFLLHIKLEGEIGIHCQRCLEDFKSSYSQEFDLAVCHSEEKAEQLMALYETLVETSNQIDLLEIVTDELHLTSPQMHPERVDCDREIARYVK